MFGSRVLLQRADHTHFVALQRHIYCTGLAFGCGSNYALVDYDNFKRYHAPAQRFLLGEEEEEEEEPDIFARQQHTLAPVCLHKREGQLLLRHDRGFSSLESGQNRHPQALHCRSCVVDVTHCAMMLGALASLQ